ncbi:pericentrin isoform X1 [Mauremys reevesii]|uniref:pericentrin isoform X1 n=2 Tax=Mauremys reevesii TaxID=260615 RepID=UPI00193F2FEC|nr:pericentrin isoform X1 [Mauremys reevesii]
MDEERRRKLEAGRAKLAHFRQRKAKSDNTQSQKKAAKRKGSSDYMQNIPKEECEIVAQDSDVLTDLNISLESKTEETETSSEKKADDLSNPDLVDDHASEEYDQLDVQMCQTRIVELEKRLLDKQEATERLTTEVDDLLEQLAQHSGATHLQELETAVQERNEIIAQLTSNLQQARQNRDDIQEEASLLADQIHGLQLQLHEANELLKSRIPGKSELSQAQEQMAVFQNRLKEQSTQLQIMHQKAHDLELQLESSQKNTKDKESLLAQKEENLSNTMQQMFNNIGDKEEIIKGLQDVVTSERSNLSLLQHTLSLRDTEIMQLKNEIASAKMKEQECIEELKAYHKRDICRQLEECHRKEIVTVKEVCEEEMNKKYKNELEQLKRENSALNSDEDSQNLNAIIIDLNNKLHESEIHRDNLCKQLKNQMEDFQRERSEIELRYKDLVEDLKLQLTNAEKQAKEAQESKQEKEYLNDEIQKLNSFIQELSEKLLFETKNNKDLKHKHDEEITIYNLKLKKLEQEEKLLQAVSESQKAELEKMQNKLCQHEGEIQLVREELEFQHGLRVDSLKTELEDTHRNQKKVKAGKDHKSYEADNMSKENMVELGSFIEDEDTLTKYLVSTERQEQSYISDNCELLDTEEGRLDKFVLDSSNILEPNMDSTADKLMFSPDEQKCLSSVLQGTSDETELDAEAFASYLSDDSLLQNEISDSKEVKDEEKAGLMERCVKLIKQLNEKESALNKSYQETQEALEKWEKATAELSIAHLELNKEREARVRCKEELDQKVKKEKELENKIIFLETQGEDRDQTVCIEELGLGIKASKSHSWQEMIEDLKQERETLMMQLRAQEQLVKEVQEQKTASDSVTSEVQSLFGRQLAALQSQRDQMQAQLDAQKAKNQTMAELLGQKTIVEETLLKEQEALKAEINNKEQSLTLTLRENVTLQERLSAVEQNLIKAEENLEKNIHDLNMKTKNFEKALECERLEFEKLKSSNLELQKLNTEIQAKKTEYIEKENKLTEEVAYLKKVQVELENHLQETVQKSAQTIQEVQSEMKRHYEEEISKMESHHLSETAKMNLVHQKEIEELNAEIKEKVEKQQNLEEERKEQIGLIKKVHEREHDREISELIIKHEDEMKELRAELIKKQQQLLDELQQQMEGTHKTEMQHAQLQSQTLHNLELEGLRLSLTNIHTSQLELMQSNLRKEKETALVELREMLNDKRAQEVAILQSRHQFELEHINEQHLKEKEEIQLKHQQELDERKKIELEMEKKHIQTLETLKGDWALKTETCLKNIREELSEKHQTEMGELQKTLKLELEGVKEERKSLSLKKEQVEMKYENLENEHQMAITKLREQLQTEHDQCLENLKRKSKEREQEMQQEMEKLQATYEELKTRSQEEIKQLWSQLDSTRASRQELSELKEQLLARTSHVDEIERLKQDFEQQRQQRRSEHETELEQLRIYFEEKLGAAEENYREELTLLHQRLQELKEYSLLESEISQDQPLDISSSVTLLEEASEKERRDTLNQLTQQLEQHKEELTCLRLQLEEKHRHELDSLRSSLALQYKEDLMKMKMDLSDRYISEIEELKKKHCLDLEQLRAKLSEEHIKEITKLRLQSAQDAARQVETEVAERVCVLENEHKAKLSLLQSEKQHIAELQGEIQHLEREITKLKDIGVQHETQLKEEMEKIKCRLVDDHKNELKRAREEVQQMEQVHKEKEEEWKCEREDLRIKAEEKLSWLRTELEDKAECEKQTLQKKFELREAEMNQLQDQQAARIVELEKSLKEQQNSLQQLEDSLASMQTTQKAQAQYDSELQAAKTLMEKDLEKATFELQEECAAKLMEAQNKFMEEHKVMTQKFTTEQELLLQELKGKHADELELQSQQLQEKHKQQILSLTAELQTKHQAEIETLKSTLQSKQQAQLEAHIAELQAKHQAQTDELEAKHLSNLDSLESSYLSEIQIIRDEHKQAVEELQMHFTEQLHEKDKANQAILTQELERLKLKHSEELQLSQDNLKIELATIHIEKLKAMAAELEEAHKEDLNTALQNQRCMLEEENHKALDVLREEVLHMEEHHKKALKELQDLHVAEVQKQKEEYSWQLQEELEKLKAQHEHEEKMYASASASEVETVRAALLAQFEEVKLKQQLQFQDEIELLKCQSEVLLEQQITQLKEEFEAERKTAWRSKEQVLIQETEKAQAHYEKEKEELSVQIQEKTNIIIQLEKKVESLNHELEETNYELETLLQRRDRENQEGEYLVAMLRSDIELSQNERKKLQESYQQVLKLFVEMVKATIATEDLICKKVGLCLDDSLASGDSRESRNMMEEMGFIQHFKAREKHDLEKSDLLDETLTEHNQVSAVTDEGSELSQHLCESVFASPDMAFENEEMILKICRRLHTAVEKLLELVTESTKQLEKTHEIHAHFEEEFSRRNQETAQVVSQHHDLMECLNEESETKNQLALELHKAEGIIEGYVVEKAALEEAMSLKEESERRLVLELESLQEQFQKLTQEQAILREERDMLISQKKALAANVGEIEVGLLKEVEFLAKEKLELQCQAEKDHSTLRSQMKVLEVELEEQMDQNQKLAKKSLEVTDLRQQIQVLEKQLRSQRQFMDEQAIEREHERDEFQQEIQKLEDQLKLSGKSQTSGEPRQYGIFELTLQIESLQAEIKDKTDDYNKLLLEKEQKYREVTVRDKEIEELAARIRELEHTNTEASKTVSRLEQELQKMKKRETELTQDKEALQQQQYNNLIQISALQSKLDEARHRVPSEGSSDHGLKEQLQAEQEALLMKEREILNLLEQLEQFKENLINKNEEILRLNLQLEMQKNLTTGIGQLQVENAHLKEDIAKLHMMQSQNVGNSESAVLQFPQALLEEKNQEIDHLNEQIERLQRELDGATDNKVVENGKSEIDELRLLVEHLRGDQERLHRDKAEEVEQLHGVIEKLQKELVQLGPMCHEVSDSQDNLNLLRLEEQAENLQNELKKGSLDFQEHSDKNEKTVLLHSKLKELQEELELVSTAREALQQLLEEKESQFKMEVEILEQNLQNVQESSRQHLAELTSLKIQYDAFQEEYSLLRTHLSQRDGEMGIMSTRIQELEDTLRAREALLLESNLQIKTVAEQRVVEAAELQHLAEKIARLEDELLKKDLHQKTEAEEVQTLQSEVSRLDFKVQTLNQKEVVYQREIDELQANAIKLKDQIQEFLKERQALRSERDDLYSQLESYKEKYQSNDQEVKLHKLVLKQEGEVPVHTNGMEKLGEETGANADQSFAASVSQSDTLILVQLEATNTSENHKDLITKMTLHQEELKSELACVKKELELSEEQTGKILEDIKEKDAAIADLKTHSRNLKTQIKQLQETLLIQEAEMTDKARELQDLKKHCQQILEFHQTPDSMKCKLNNLSQNTEHDKETPKDFKHLVMDMTSWDSPEIVRKQETSIELQPSLHLTPFSEVDSVHSTDFEMKHNKSSVVQGDTPGLLGYQSLYANTNEEAVARLDLKSPAFSESTYSIPEYQNTEKRILVRDVDNFTLTPSDSQDDLRSTMSGLEGASDGYVSNTSSDLAAKLNRELETTEHLDASFTAYLQYCGIFQDAMDPVKEKETISPQLKSVLKMVYEDSRRILALSEHPFPLTDQKSIQQSAAAEGWRNEGLTLLSAIQSLKDYLSKVEDRGDKESSDTCFDWRGELLQAVQSVLEKERNMFQIDLQSHLCNPGSGDEGSLVEKLEHIVKRQEEQQRIVLEHLLSSDRNSLLCEIQDLRAQLRMAHLQNQEKLQQLQETLTNAEDRGSKQEHQLRRKVELLEYKLQQEKTIASDLQKSLSEEQERASEMHELLKQEQSAVSDLKSELYESKEENESLQKSLQKLQREINQLRSELENKEKDLTVALQDLQNEHSKQKELRNIFEEQHLQHKLREDEKTKALEELQAALELQCIQNNQMSVALEHEKSANDNLRKELQIEHSRCEALLSQERNKLTELQRNLEVEKNHSLELLNALNHERVLTEQLSMRVNEDSSCKHKESLVEQTFVQELQAQLDEERARAMELAAIIEKTHQQAIQSKRQLEAEVQMCCEETQKEREVSTKLRATLESLQSQKQEVIRSLEIQREREAKLKVDWEQLQILFRTMKEQEKSKKEEREKERRQEQRAEFEKRKEWQKDKERVHELELQHQRDEHRIKELQQTLAELEKQERNLASQKSQRELSSCPIKNDYNANLSLTTETEALHLQQQQLEKIRQQLLFAAVHLNEFIYKTVDKTVNDWSASNDEAIASLLHTLKELKSELLTSSTPLKPLQGSVSLVDLLLKENGELTKSVTTLTEEKLELRAAISQLEKNLQQHHHRGIGNRQICSTDDAHSVQESERASWQREKTILQNALKQAESELAKATVEIENKPVMETSNPKLQKLYRKYLRAESFRKALVYQKKYLLLLLGGFQDCEQATLSLIARMGVYPSPADLQVSESRSRPFTKFRSAVRVVIAVSRLKFLVKKWHKVNRKGAQGENISHSIGHNPVSGARTEVLRQQQLPSVNVNSPPTRDIGSCHRTCSARFVSHSPKSSYWLHNRLHPSTSSVSEKSLVSTQDPERSLTEYIHRLEVIQQRLGGAQTGNTPGPPHQRNIK